MNKNIIKMFPKTEDAVLMSKYWCEELNNPIFLILIKGKEDEIIAELKRAEEIKETE